MRDNIERRAFTVGELRAAADEESRMVTGHAAVFDELSHEIGGFRERIAHGAFTETIQKDDVRALWNHDSGTVLGRSQNKTLRLVEDKRGLAFELDVAETSVGNDALVSIRRGDITDMSFGFIAIEDEWSQEPGQGLATRTLRKLKLLDVSPVTFPAYPQTDVATRSLEAWRQTQDQVDQAEAETRERRLRLEEAETEILRHRL